MRRIVDTWSLASLLSLLLWTNHHRCVHGMTEETVRSLLDETQAFLVDSFAAMEEKSVTEAIESLQREIEGLQTLRHQLERQEKSVDRLVARANAKQLEGLIERLDDTLTKELLLRQLTEEGKEEEDSEEDEEFVSIEDLEEKFKPTNVLGGSESELSEWALKILQDELNEYKMEILKPIAGRKGSSTKGCPTATQVVQNVQAALTKYSQDGIGIIDHAQGGEIVHSMTSLTYVPPPGDHELLGNVWWRKYIPEDWESWLPTGWEYWNVGVPSYLYHSLNLSGAKTSPPETILEKKVLPGSCWPMQGSRGQVTFRLPYPIKVESFSLDHVSFTIVPEDALESAPKKLKVFVYPPCPVEEECAGLGFDAEDPMEVAQIDYRVDGPSVQTFDSIFVAKSGAKIAAVEKEENELGDDDEEEEEEGASCSTEAAACSAPPKIDVAAITVKVLENHGNPDYTCMYRFRVHGEQVFSR